MVFYETRCAKFFYQHSLEKLNIHEKFLPTVRMEYLPQSDGDKLAYEEQLAAYADMVREHGRLIDGSKTVS